MIPLGDSISLTNHQHLENKIGKIAEKIRDQGEKRKLIAKTLRQVKNEIQLDIEKPTHGPLEPNLVYPVEEKPLKNLSVAGIDGGVLTKPLHGLDLILVRAVSAIFHYNGGGLKNADYHPNEMPAPQLINIHEPLDSRELDVLTGLKRQQAELDRAQETLENRNIDALLLDGSVVPQYTNHAFRTSTRKLYKKLANSFTQLYETCLENNVLLLGAIKDSRSARLARIFQKEIFPKVLENANLTQKEIETFNKNKNVILNSRDTAFLDYFLDPGERSFTFQYSTTPTNLLEGIGDWKNKICAFYIKPVPYDRPTRVELVTKKENNLTTVNKAATLINSLSAAHEACALPTVLIEADARAALEKEEITILRDSIADKLEPSTMLDLRRERRPF